MVTRAVFDTNILIDYAKGEPRAAALFQYYDELVISRMTWMEFMVGVDSSKQKVAQEASDMMSMFEIYDIDNNVANVAVRVRKETKAKFPDAIIHATALLLGIEIVTRNPADFRDVSFMSNVKIIEPSMF